nr:hypothetical protein HmN_000957800 [Hymenolepis microstoma]
MSEAATTILLFNLRPIKRCPHSLETLARYLQRLTKLIEVLKDLNNTLDPKETQVAQLVNLIKDIILQEMLAKS